MRRATSLVKVLAVPGSGLGVTAVRFSASSSSPAGPGVVQVRALGDVEAGNLVSIYDKNDVRSLAGVGVLSSPGEEGAISFASNQVEPVTAVPSSTCTHVPRLPAWPHEHSHRPSLVSCSVNGCSCWADSWVATKHHEPPAVATTMPAGESTRGSARPCGCARSCSAWLA